MLRRSLDAQDNWCCVVPVGTGEFFKAEDHALQDLHVRDLG